MKYKKLRLLRARRKLVLQDDFENLDGWNVLQGDWHTVTADTNADKSAGLPGGLAIECAGAFSAPSVMARVITLADYGELVFDHYVQNPVGDTEENYLTFYVDDAKKLEVKGPSPWTICEPIGLTPGEHELKFEYTIINGLPYDKKAVVDTFMVWEAEEVDCLITESTPPRPLRNISGSKTLRGHTRYQQMTASDTSISFTALFNGLQFKEFIAASDEFFYFVDEYGTAYRGIFPEKIEPRQIAMNELYEVSLEMSSPYRPGFGFC